MIMDDAKFRKMMKKLEPHEVRRVITASPTRISIYDRLERSLPQRLEPIEGMGRAPSFIKPRRRDPSESDVLPRSVLLSRSIERSDPPTRADVMAEQDDAIDDFLADVAPDAETEVPSVVAVKMMEETEEDATVPAVVVTNNTQETTKATASAVVVTKKKTSVPDSTVTKKTTVPAVTVTKKTIATPVIIPKKIKTPAPVVMATPTQKPQRRSIPQVHKYRVPKTSTSHPINLASLKESWSWNFDIRPVVRKTVI